MKPRDYVVLERALEEGVQLGLKRVFKHREDPLTEDQERVLTEQLPEQILDVICEWFTFEGEEGD